MKKILSHNNPDKNLEEHLKNVGDYSEKIIKSKNLQTSLITPENLEKISYIIGITHDFGKSTSYFQELLEDRNKRNRYSNHALISALFTRKTLEIFSRNLKIQPVFPELCYMLVKRHHGNLESLKESYPTEEDKDILKKQISDIKENKKNLKKIYNPLLRKIGIKFSDVLEAIDKDIANLRPIQEKLKILLSIRKMKQEETIELFLISNLLFSVLIDSDKKDAANIIKTKTKEITGDRDFVDNYLMNKIKTEEKFDPEKPLNKIKNKFYKEVTKNKKLSIENKIYTVTAPTGVGKTFAIYSTALKLKDKIKEVQNTKIIYALPYTSIIDQNYLEIENILRYNLNSTNLEKNKSNYLIKYHYLTGKKWTSENYNSKSLLDDILLTGSWESQNIVTTFVQIFHSIIGYKNSFLRKFHNIVNSIIILDEIQVLPVEYWKIVEDIFKVLSEKFNTYFIFSTATQPYIFKKEDYKTLLEDEQEYFEKEIMDRVTLYNKTKTKIELDDLLELMKKEIEKNTNRVIVVLNTKKSATEFYEKIKKDKKFGKYKKFYLTNNLIPKHRMKVIEKIMNEKKEKILVVSTQLIEAGVDISFKEVYRDLAPFDSVIQTAGRCNRYGEYEENGKMYLLNVVDTKNKEKPYSSYIYDHELLINTKKLLKQEKYNSKSFYSLIDTFFKESRNSKEEKSKRLLNAVKNLNYDEKKKGEEDPVKDFKIIKNLPKTVDIFIIHDKEAKKLLQKYQELKNKEPLDRLEKTKELKPKINEYVVEITEKMFKQLMLPPKNEITENFFYIPHNLSKEYYDFDEDKCTGIGIKDIGNVI